MTEPITVEISDVVRAVQEHPKYLERVPDASPAHPILIGIAGGSGAGKDYVSGILMQALEATRLSMDDYYKSAEFTPDGNYDHPQALDLDLLSDHIKTLKAGNFIDKPVYDMITNKRVSTERVEPTRLIILDGLFVLLNYTRGDLDIALYVETHAEVRLNRRLKRDMEERGCSHQSIMQQWKDSVLPMHNLYVEPQKNFADFIVVNE